ncbi:Branched-chain amino acid aminotransferase [hydrothermal vent metagenome]|uniref:branched-chain-amino-acid transaminase n=1 Tax=hydrothermal vent metagenome TaxID=652676 RepID=A0A3B0R6Q6_9ZZZZ
MKKSEKIWMDGKLVAWDEANVHVLTHTLHYGLGAFEGIRCYATDGGGSAIFRLGEHTKRFFESAKILQIDIPYSEAEVDKATVDIIKANKLEECYIRSLVFLGDGAMGIFPKDNPVRVALAAWEWGAYLGEDGLSNGIRAKVSSFARHHVNSAMTKSKTTGAYFNSILSKREVVSAGYDEAIMLDTDGYVSEASGENIFMVKNGRIKTTSLTSILKGITRDSVMRIAADLEIEVTEQRFTRDELYTADEVFLTGTAAEVTPVREIDDRKIGAGKRGPITERIQKIYFDAVKGRAPQYESWLTRI